jgi:hypothetical protein
MLGLVVNFINQGVPVCDISAAFLKVGRFDYFLQ